MHLKRSNKTNKPTQCWATHFRFGQLDSRGGIRRIFPIYLSSYASHCTSTSSSMPANWWRARIALSIKCGVQCENVTHLPSVGQVFVRGLHLFKAMLVRVIQMNITSWHFVCYPDRSRASYRDERLSRTQRNVLHAYIWLLYPISEMA